MPYRLARRPRESISGVLIQRALATRIAAVDRIDALTIDPDHTLAGLEPLPCRLRLGFDLFVTADRSGATKMRPCTYNSRCI
jgi:hypothetical protein